eukprot:7389579-Pyramimonas_sp.AAC.1
MMVAEGTETPLPDADYVLPFWACFLSLNKDRTSLDNDASCTGDRLNWVSASRNNLRAKVTVRE